MLQANASPRQRKLLQTLGSTRFAKGASRLWALPQRYVQIATAIASIEVQPGSLTKLSCWVLEKSAQLLLRTLPETKTRVSLAKADRKCAAEVFQSLLVGRINLLAREGIVVGAIVKGIGERFSLCIQLFSRRVPEYIEASK